MTSPTLASWAARGICAWLPFGDWAGLQAAVEALFADPEATARQRRAGRRLFQRQFSYAAARANLDLAMHRALATSHGVLPAAERFAVAFAAFRQRLEGR